MEYDQRAEQGKVVHEEGGWPRKQERFTSLSIHFISVYFRSSNYKKECMCIGLHVRIDADVNNRKYKLVFICVSQQCKHLFIHVSYVYGYMCFHAHACKYARVYVFIHAYVHVRMYVCMYLCICVGHVCMYASN